MNRPNFEELFQAEFAPMAEKFPIGSEIFANGKVYTVTDFQISNGVQSYVVVDRKGNEACLKDGEFEKFSFTSDTVTCFRCGGSGRHSYNLKDGSVCYGCGGNGRTPKLPKEATKTLKMVVSTDAIPFKKGEEVKVKFINVSEKYGEAVYMVENKFGTGFKMRHSQVFKNCEVK